MVKLGNDHYMCPVLAHPGVDTPQHPEPQWPVARGPTPGPLFVMEPELPAEYLDPAAMDLAILHNMQHSETALYRQRVAMQAFLHFKARSTNHGHQAEHHRRQAEAVRAWGGDLCPWVIEHQRAEHMHNEHRARTQNQAFVAYQLSHGNINPVRHQVIHEGQVPAFPSLPRHAYGPPPGALMPASGFGSPSAVPGYDQFTVAVDPSYSTVGPAPIFVTPEHGLPVNLTNGALITESRGVFVGNLPYDTEWKDLKTFLNSAGNLEKCDVPRSGGKARGYGTALFATVEEAQRACNMFDQQWFRGRQIKVRPDKYTRCKQRDDAPALDRPSGPLVVTSVAAH